MRISDWSSDVCSSDLVASDLVAVLAASGGCQLLECHGRRIVQMPAMRRHELLQDFAAHRLLHPAAPGLIIPQQQSGRTELADSGIALLRRAPAAGVEKPAREVVLADRRDLQQLHRGAAEVADR